MFLWLSFAYSGKNIWWHLLGVNGARVWDLNLSSRVKVEGALWGPLGRRRFKVCTQLSSCWAVLYPLSPVTSFSAGRTAAAGGHSTWRGTVDP